MPPPHARRLGDGQRCRLLLSAPNGAPTGLYPPELASQPLFQPPVTTCATALKPPFWHLKRISGVLYPSYAVTVHCSETSRARVGAKCSANSAHGPWNGKDKGRSLGPIEGVQTYC